MTSNQQTSSALQLLAFALGGTAFLAGLDKFTNLLTDWDRYLSEPARRRLHMRPRNFMRLVGIVEMAVGATILRGHTRAGGYLAGAWLLGISANLVASGKYFDIAVRDLDLAVAAYALASLSQARQAARAWPHEVSRAASNPDRTCSIGTILDEKCALTACNFPIDSSLYLQPGGEQSRLHS